MITVKTLAWAAGFLEGEGSFNAPNRKIGSTVAVSAAQVQREPLERLLGMFGGGISGRRNGTVLAWVVYGPRAAGVMMTVYPMMSPRRKAAIRRALTGWREQRMAGPLRTHCAKGHPFTG